ncbi:hypothetical protein N656DRAFT_828141 [Canariomyces notabilis]|uniref:Uncharacterized protein n=1 Tax=Canariomyces notabilis TaxID=2074819 RepID=A0AAN6YVD3_9PEZI|nr:hypothetical protein N656DRAFT_828141 [Canariomyces arenarius]
MTQALATPMQIRRKPVPNNLQTQSASSNNDCSAEQKADQPPPPLPDRLRFADGPRDAPMHMQPGSREDPELFLQVPESHHRLRPQTSLPDLTRFATTRFETVTPAPSSTTINSASTFGPSASSTKAFLQNAFTEARHFAGGLIPQPIESTKHYTILRHSPPLILYRGPSTSVTITIFSSPEHLLPADRTLWLQQRGFSGDSGMKVKAFFNATSGWLDVTPSTQLQTQHLKPDTARAWQRDITKAAKALIRENGEAKAHVARETHVLRIPKDAEDGYFRLILCTGGPSAAAAGQDANNSSFKRKVLCSSPIFRVASVSTDSSKFRGASLTTLPLEVGVFVASKVATTAVETYTAPVRQPVQAVVDRARPGFVGAAIGGLVLDKLGERVDAKKDERDQASGLDTRASDDSNKHRLKDVYFCWTPAT